MQEQILDYLDGGPDYHEIHSKTMELLAEPYAEGFFGTDAECFLTEKRYCMIKELCAFCQIYAFESYLYTHEDAPVEEWAKQYYEIGKTFGRGLHSEQWEDAIVNGGILLDSMALFFAPMYVISYALSELCALQLKEAYDANPADGWAKYRAICACGSSKPLEESLREAGLTPPYAPGTVKRIAVSLEKLLFGA